MQRDGLKQMHRVTLMSNWKFHEGFPEIPPEIAESSKWKTIFAGPFSFKEHIGVKEGRGFLWGLRHSAKRADQYNCRKVFRVDNFGVACALARGRSPAHCLLQLCHRVSALCLANGILPCIRWLP